MVSLKSSFTGFRVFTRNYYIWLRFSFLLWSLFYKAFIRLIFESSTFLAQLVSLLVHNPSNGSGDTSLRYFFLMKAFFIRDPSFNSSWFLSLTLPILFGKSAPLYVLWSQCRKIPCRLFLVQNFQMSWEWSPLYPKSEASTTIPWGFFWYHPPIWGERSWTRIAFHWRTSLP